MEHTSRFLILLLLPFAVISELIDGINIQKQQKIDAIKLDKMTKKIDSLFIVISKTNNHGDQK